MTAARVLLRRGGARVTLLASLCVNGLVLAAALPVWWASRRELASALVLHGEVAALPLAAVSAWLFVASGRRDPLAWDGRGARYPGYLLVLRILMVVAAAVVGYLLAVGVCLGAVTIVGGGSATIGRGIAFGALSVVTAVTIGSCCGLLLRKWTAAPIAAGVVMVAMLLLRPSGLVATFLMWPVLGVPSYFEVALAPFVASVLMLCATVVAVTFAVQARQSVGEPGPAVTRPTFRVSLGAVLFLMVVAAVQHAHLSGGPVALASLRPADQSHCAGTLPSVCLWDDNAGQAQRIASALGQVHAATKSWPTAMTGTLFAEEGLQRDGKTVVMGGQTIAIYPPRLGRERGVPSLSTVAANWTSGCGGQPIPSQAMEMVLTQLAEGRAGLDTAAIRSELSLPAQC